MEGLLLFDPTNFLLSISPLPFARKFIIEILRNKIGRNDHQQRPFEFSCDFHNIISRIYQFLSETITLQNYKCNGAATKNYYAIFLSVILN